MCGIIGVTPAFDTGDTGLHSITQLLLNLSETRGSEAAGLAVLTTSGLTVTKSAESASVFCKSSEFAEAVDMRRDDLVGVIGHTRLVTNGSAIFAENNQPVATQGLVMVHNGIVTNFDSLWAELGRPLAERPDIDSSVLLTFIADRVAGGRSAAEATYDAFGELNGSASVAILCERTNELVLATNIGSLYVGLDDAGRVLVFGSERRILESFAEHRSVHSTTQIAQIKQVAAGAGLRIDLLHGDTESLVLAPYQPRADGHPTHAPAIAVAAQAEPSPPTDGLRRCTKCVLPETVPFITFDANGVCSVCARYEKVEVSGDEALDLTLSNYRSSDGSPDCILAFSGGRDSAYGMHRLVKDFGMTPLALTYDWGMVTDLARRNQARMCGTLGVEHILISADIAAKRRNIGSNLRAWLHKPDLGMVPLLMAGDKQFFTHSQQLAKKTGINLVVFCTNPLEMTYFKSGFAGVRDQRYYTGGLANKLRLAAFYGRGFLTNPRYLNRSLLDTGSAFRASYFTAHDYVQLFEHLSWDEDEINKCLIDDYTWETDPSTPTTWRIGDGTAPFYNWVYQAAVGFTENDTFRSNQVREGFITRDRALELVHRENQVRWERIEEYLDLVDVSLEEAKDGIDRLVASLQTKTTNE